MDRPWTLAAILEIYDAVRLALQLPFRFEMRLTCCGLMGASEDGPREDVSAWDTALCELYGEATDFLN